MTRSAVLDRPRPRTAGLRNLVVLTVTAAVALLAAGPVRAETTTAGPVADDNARSSSYSTYGSLSVETADGDVLVRYPTRNGVMAPQRPLVVVGHGMGMDPNKAMAGHQYLVAAGYVVAVPPLGASTRFKELARKVSRSLDAVLAEPQLAEGILRSRIGYSGASMGGMTGIAMQDPRLRDPRFKAFVIKSGKITSGVDPSWSDAPPMLFVLGTKDTVVSPEYGREAYRQAGGPKGKIELPGAGHTLIEPIPTPTVSTAALAFFAHYLGGVDDALDGIAAAVARDPNAPTYDHDWTQRSASPSTVGGHPAYSLDASDVVGTSRHREVHEIVVTRSQLLARVEFAFARTPRRAERLVMLLRTSNDRELVARTRGAGVLRLAANVQAGTYRLVLRKPDRLADRRLTYSLHAAPRAA